MKLPQTKAAVLKISEHTWRYYEMGKDANGIERAGITAGPHVFLSGLLAVDDVSSKIKFAAESPNIVSQLVDHVNFWQEIALKFYTRCRPEDAWIWRDAEIDYEKLEKKIEYASERIMK